MDFSLSTCIPEDVSWGNEQEMSYEKNLCITMYDTINGKTQSVAYALIGECKDGFYLDGISVTKIHNILSWVEVKPEYRNKKYGTHLVCYIRDMYMNKKSPICLLAYKTSHDRSSFYYQLGAIFLLDENSSENLVMAFMDVDQIKEYYPEER